MAKRVKYVHTPDMVAHLWAHQAQDSARSSGRGRLYFEGDTIYSYGSHFPIARHVMRGAKMAVLFTTRSYSVTTAGHKHCVYSACNHLPTFHVDSVHGSHKAHLAEYKARIARLLVDYGKARGRKPECLNLIETAVEQGNAYAKFFGLKTRFTMPANVDELREECAKQAAKNEELAEKRRVRYEKEHAERQERWAREEVERKEKAEKEIVEWLAGERNDLPHRGWDDPVRLRIAGEELQTSLGATVPLDHAIRAFKVIQRLYERGATYQRNGHTIHLGHFALDEIEADGTLVASYHRIAQSEIERVAKLAGVA